MRAASARFAATLTGPRVAALRVDSWLAGRFLADVPVAAGSWEEDGSSKVPERVTISVPRSSEWTPTTLDHPLANVGQRLRISRGVVLPDTRSIEYVQLGWVRVQGSSLTEDTVDVEAVGLAAILEDARLLAPVQTGGTYESAARALTGNTLPLLIGVGDRGMPARAWEDNRLDALYELADTWPAALAVNPSGVLQFSAAFDDQRDRVVATFAEGEQGTVVSALPATSRDGIFNAVRATGEESGDAPPVVAVAYDLDPGSPTYWDGPYGQVPMFYSSPLITTVQQAQSAANTRLGNVRRRTRAFTVQALIDPRIQAGDVVAVASAAVTGVARVDKVSIPLLPGASGVMSLTAHLLPGRAAA